LPPHGLPEAARGRRRRAFAQGAFVVTADGAATLVDADAS
jgi:hypothetical protein